MLFRSMQREIKRGLVENLTTLLEVKYVYSADVSEQKYRYNMTAKGPNLKLDANYKLVEYIENVMDIYHKLDLSSLSEYQCAKTILTFLVSVLKYDNELAAEISSGLSYGKSASWVLENKKGTCGEYSNLFIALMRLKGIPCKFVTGLYCSSGQVTFHAWAEFYDSRNGWIAVEPQGGILGVSSNHIKLKEGIDFADTNFDMAKCDFKIRCIKK